VARAKDDPVEIHERISRRRAQRLRCAARSDVKSYGLAPDPAVRRHIQLVTPWAGFDGQRFAGSKFPNLITVENDAEV